MHSSVLSLRHRRFGPTTTIPASQDFHHRVFRVDAIKHFEILLHDEPPDSRALPHFRVTLGEGVASARVCDGSEVGLVGSATSKRSRAK